MSLTVELGAIGGFTLDDPEKGVLDNITYRLEGVLFSDVTAFAKEVAISRGKNRDLQRFQAGRVQMSLKNQNREFDPLFPSAQFAENLKPRLPVRISYSGERIFTGIIEDWNYSFDVSGESIADIVAVDELSLLAQQELSTGTAIPQTSGERVSAILDLEEVNWPAGERDIDTGVSELGADVFDGNVLRYLQKVEASEQGQLFVNRSGDLQFRSRLDATPTSDSFLTLADDGTGIPYTKVDVNYGTELLYNRATVSGPPGSVTRNNLSSQTTYGITEYDFDTLVNTLTQLANLSDFIVSKYAEPELRFEALQVSFDGVTTAQRNDLTALELGDVMLVKFTPNGVGVADPIEQYGQVIRIDHDIRVDAHDMIIGLASLEWNFLVLDDAEFGKLNSGHLAF